MESLIIFNFKNSKKKRRDLALKWCALYGNDVERPYFTDVLVSEYNKMKNSESHAITLIYSICFNYSNNKIQYINSKGLAQGLQINMKNIINGFFKIINLNPLKRSTSNRK